MTTSRVIEGAGWARFSALPRGPRGWPLCRWCSRETPGPRRTFCGPDCVHEWKIRSQPTYARSVVWGRDGGVCASCATQCGRTGESDTPWEMDHIIPVVEGGGACGLENLRTLCRPCHVAATKLLTLRRCALRRLQADVDALMHAGRA